MDTIYQTPAEMRDMLALHLPALLHHAETICATTEMSEAQLPPMLVHIYGGAPDLRLGDMLRCWTCGQENLWHYTDERGQCCYRILSVHGLGGCYRSEAADSRGSLSDVPRCHSFFRLLQAVRPFRRKPAHPAPMSLAEVIARVDPLPRLIVNIPHASTRLLKHCGLSIPREEQERLARFSADLYTDELAPAGCTHLIAPLSRLVVDTERFADDAAEPAAAVGSGVIPTRAFDGTILREHPSERRRKRLLNRYYHPHHAALARHVRSELAIHGTARILDLHSYPESYEMPGMTGRERPDVCIGFEPYHCPAALVEAVAVCARNHGYTTAFNAPFAGSIIPLEHYRQHANVLSLMLELKRSCYMDEQTLEQHDGMECAKHFVAEAADIIRDFTLSA